MKRILTGIAFIVAAAAASAQDASGPILFTNVNVFDGVNEALIENANVVITDNLITSISTEPLAVAGGRVIDGGGRTMIPGLIDVHWHSFYANIPVSALASADMAEIAIAGMLGAEQTLLRGFTTVRDIGGNPFAVKKFADAGTVPGPRMFVSGPPLSQTGGHFDLGAYSDVPSNPADSLPYWQRVGLFATGDGIAEVTKRTREILRMGATQIKIAGGGGVTSIYDPLDVQEYSFEEMQAIVGCGRDLEHLCRRTHLYRCKAIQTAIKAGVKSIEHGNLIMEEETLQMMKDNGVWLSAQPLIDDEDRLVFDNPISTAKWIEVTDGTGRNYEAAKAMGVKIAFGTDMLFDPAAAARQGKMVTKLKNWFTPFEALKMVTSDNAELLMMSGPRNPYQEGPLGVIAEGAYADLILVDGNPLENLDLVGDAEANFDLIMKDGVIYKNTLQ
jgi:imidazolonepropionase-like amidohydrolase